MPNVLFVLAPTDFRDEEFLVPQQILVAAGYGGVVASLQPGVCRGKLGAEVIATLAVAAADARDFAAVVFVGGGGSHVFFHDAAVHQLARTAVAEGRVLAAICAAPAILAYAGVLAGRAATCFSAPEYRAALAAGEAEYRPAPVVTAGRIVTANGPAAAEQFGRAICELLNPAA